MSKNEDVLEIIADKIDEYSELKSQLEIIMAKKTEIKSELNDLFEENALQKVEGSTHYAEWGNYNSWNWSELVKAYGFDKKYKISKKTLYIRKQK